MTRGEILDFLNDFSRSSRVSRSENTADPGKSPQPNAVMPPQPDIEQPSTAPAPAKSTTAAGPTINKSSTTTAKMIPVHESPLAYGYPMSSKTQTDRPATVPAATAPTIFVTAPGPTGDDGTNNEIAKQAVAGGRNGGPTKSIIPSADLNAYTKFKKIPEARDLKIDDDMRVFLGGFGLLQPSSLKSGKSIGTGATANGTLQRRADVGVIDIDDDDNTAAGAESVDQRLLESVLLETGNGQVNASQLLDRMSSRDHVFNPSDTNVKTVDVNRIAKIVENIRLLTDGENSTVPLPQDFIQKKIENITASITDIDKPTDTGAPGHAKAFNGYEVFFDDDSKEIDSDLPELPAAAAAADDEASLNEAINQPDPLSTDELQQLLEKTKNDVKRQEPKDEATSSTVADVISASSEATTAAVTAVTAVSADSSSEATSTVEVTSDGGDAARDAQTTAGVNPSLSQLAESFGGGETASEPPMTDVSEVPANRPRNGLYFYVDWNSFLTVNDGQKNQVNLRFAPKAGNPAHFLRVVVP